MLQQGRRKRGFYITMPQTTGGSATLRCIYAGTVLGGAIYIMCGNYYGRGKYTLWVRGYNDVEIQV